MTIPQRRRGMVARLRTPRRPWYSDSLAWIGKTVDGSVVVDVHPGTWEYPHRGQCSCCQCPPRVAFRGWLFLADRRLVLPPENAGSKDGERSSWDGAEWQRT